MFYCRGKPVIVECPENQDFKLRPEQLRKITPKTKWLMLNSPSNPTGAVYSKDELKDLAKVLNNHPMFLLCAMIFTRKLFMMSLSFIP